MMALFTDLILTNGFEGKRGSGDRSVKANFIPHVVSGALVTNGPVRYTK